MIAIKDSGIILNKCFDDEISQEANSTYQLKFSYPVDDDTWEELKEEVLLTADDLHGEQEFSIIEVEKYNGYITVYANQVATLLNGYSINKLSVDRVNGATVMQALISASNRPMPFTLYSDIEDKHTLNVSNQSVMDTIAKDKHCIIGQWGGDLIRDKYAISLLKNGGSENESLFMYRKNLHTIHGHSSSKNLATRIHFWKKIESHEEGKKDQLIEITLDSPLIDKYRNIYEDNVEVNDEKITDIEALKKYGQDYFKNNLCDMIEDTLEIDVIGQPDVPVHMFDVVTIFHERYNVDLRKKIMKYTYSPVSKRLKSIGFGQISRTVNSIVHETIENKVNDAIAVTKADFKREFDNSNKIIEQKQAELEHQIEDGIEQAKSKAEVVKAEINSDIQSKLSPIQIDVQNFKRDFGGELIRLKNELIPNINQNTTDLTATKRRLTELFDQEQAKINDIKINNDALKRQLNESLEGILDNFEEGILANVDAFKSDTSSKIEANQISLTQIKTDLIQTDKGLTQLSQKTVDSEKRLIRNETDIRRLNDEVSSKVTKTDFDKVSNRLTTAETLVRQTADSLISKVNRTDFDRISGRVSTAETGLTQVANEIKLKASKSDVDSLTGRVAKTESSIQVANDRITSEVGRVETNLSSIRTTLTQTASTLETKASKTDFDVSNRRLSNAETQINTLAGSIETKLSSTQLTDILNSKGYQNLSQVNTLISQSAGNLRTTLSEVERKIPTEIGGPNLIRNGAFPTKITPWSGNLKISKHGFYFNGNKTLFVLETFTSAENVTFSNRFDVKRNTDYTLSFYGFASWNVSSMDVNFLARKNGETVEFSSVKEIVSKKRLSTSHSEYVSVTFNSGDNDNAIIRFDNNGSINSSTSWLFFGEVTLIEGRTSQKWSPALEDLVTETKFNEVIDTVSSHTRTIGENSNKISQAIQTADSIRQSVSELSANALKQSDVSITSSGIVMRAGITDPKKSVGDLAAASFRLNPYQIDLFADKIRVIGDMLVDGAITSRKIASGSIDTAQLRAGAVTATILNTNAVTADKLRVDEALFNKLSAGEVLAQKLFAKSAFITSVQSVDLSANRITSGMLRARNGAVNFNLDSGQLNFYTDAPALRRVIQGYPNQFIAFKTGTYDNKPCGVTIIGSNRDEVENTNSGSFAGIRIWNSEDADQTDVIGDIIHLSSNPNDDSDGWRVDTLHYKLNIQPRRQQDYRSSQITAGDFIFINSDGRRFSLRQLFKDLFHNTQEFGNRTGGYNNLFTQSAPD